MQIILELLQLLILKTPAHAGNEIKHLIPDGMHCHTSH
jgi:hypothetical protein